jgi:hypothetical protein
LTRADRAHLLGRASPSPSKRSADEEKEAEADERNRQLEGLVFERIKSDDQFHLALF